jgi:2-polyprenyl-3-methyl-5-hydroxy-6-metoxy-1,4-benzoquinol methylase
MTSNCPLCDTNNYKIIYEHLDQYTDAAIVKCSHCLHVYTLLSNNVEPGNLYNDKVYKVVENRNTIFDKILGWEYKKVIKRIYFLKPSTVTLLDFGSGKGKFASLAQNKGWQVKCVETAAKRAEYAKKVYGLDINTNFYSTGKIFNTDFDVITLFHVLEHLPDPKTLLRELIKHNLAKNGLVIIEVPNYKSVQARIAGSRWMHLDVPRHIHHFIPAELDQIGQELNLATVKTTFFSFHLGVLGMTDSFLKLLGYRKNIIYELKNRKSKILILGIAVLLPFAFISEFFAAMTGRGGIIRKYFIKRQ